MKAVIYDDDLMNPMAFATIKLIGDENNCAWLKCYKRLAADKAYAAMSGFMNTDFIQLVKSEAQETVFKMTNTFLSDNFLNQLRATKTEIEYRQCLCRAD